VVGVDGRVLAASVADVAARRRGLIGRDGIEGAPALAARSIHALRMRFPIDGAIATSGSWWSHGHDEPEPHRSARMARAVIEAEAGSFARWGLRPGDALEVEE
jgi:hypothetical protein